MSSRVECAHLILYVRDQGVSAEFYQRALDCRPRLDVPGMTEFVIGGGAVLGLIPEAGIRRLLGDALPDPATARGVPRSELYLLVDHPTGCLRRAVECGARLLSPVATRDWGHVAGYCLDPDGHVLAFGAPLGEEA